jgi:chromosome segregation ATPase
LTSRMCPSSIGLLLFDGDVKLSAQQRSTLCATDLSMFVLTFWASFRYFSNSVLEDDWSSPKTSQTVKKMAVEYSFDPTKMREQRRLELENHELKLENMKLLRELREFGASKEKIDKLEAKVLQQHDELLSTRVKFEERLKNRIEEAVSRITELRKKYKELKAENKVFSDKLAEAETVVKSGEDKLRLAANNETSLQAKCASYKKQVAQLKKQQSYLREQIERFKIDQTKKEGIALEKENQYMKVIDELKKNNEVRFYIYSHI